MGTFLLEPVFVPERPEVFEDGKNYICLAYKWSGHLCPCGCGKINDVGFMGSWTFIFDGKVTIRPSIGNPQCGAHYFITENEVVSAGPMESTASTPPMKPFEMALRPSE